MSTPVEITWLLAAVSKGDADAFERLYVASSAKLYGVALRIVRRHDLAADVMEEAYLQIWEGAGEFNPTHSTPLAWMVAITRATGHRRRAAAQHRCRRPGGDRREGGAGHGAAAPTQR